MNFQLLNDIYAVIRDLPEDHSTACFRMKSSEIEEAFSIMNALLTGSISDRRWRKRFLVFTRKQNVAGVALADSLQNDEVLLDDFLASCDEEVLDALAVQYGESTQLGIKIKEYASRFHVNEKALIQQISMDLSDDDSIFYCMLRELILKKYESPSKYYNKIRFSRKLFSKTKKSDYTLNRENALWLIVGLEPDYWEFVRLLNAAGYSLREGNRRDTIIKFVIKNGEYTLDSLNQILHFFHEECIGVS